MLSTDIAKGNCHIGMSHSKNIFTSTSNVLLVLYWHTGTMFLCRKSVPAGRPPQSCDQGGYSTLDGAGHRARNSTAVAGHFCS